MVALSVTSGGQGLVAACDTQDGNEAGLRAAILEEIPPRCCRRGTGHWPVSVVP